MKILLLDSYDDLSSTALEKVALKAGWNVKQIPLCVMRTVLVGLERRGKIKDPVIYGRSNFCHAAAHYLSLSLLEPTFEWLAGISKDYRLRDVICCSLSEVKNNSQKAFIKTIDNSDFAAKVYENGASELSSLWSNPLILMSEPVEWNTEFRFFVLDGEIQSFSLYARNRFLIRGADSHLPSAQESQEALNFCRRVVSDLAGSLPSSVVIDVGEIVDRGWAVVDANPSFSSKIYGCDASNVLPVIERAFARESKTDNEK